jgi:CRISPR-associated endonuclease/helicase Cas3
MELKFLSHPNKRLTTHIETIRAFDTDKLFKCVAAFHDLGKTLNGFQQYIVKKTQKAEPHAPISALAFANAKADMYDAKTLLFGVNAVYSHHGKLRSTAKLVEFLGKRFGLERKSYKRQYDEIVSDSNVRAYWALPKSLDEDKLEEISEIWEDEISFDIEDYIEQKLLFSKLIYADKYEAIFSQTPAKSPFEYTQEELDELEEWYQKTGRTFELEI